MNDMYTNTSYGVTFKKYMTSVYAWMFLGIMITFVVAYAFGTSMNLIYSLVTFPMIDWILLIAQLGIVIALSARLMKFSPTMVKVLFIAYSVLTGVSFSYLPLLFGIRSIFSAFLVTSIFFGCLAFIGHTTKMDLTKLGTFCMAGVMALVIYSLLAMIFKWEMNTFLYCVIGLVLFLGLTAYDVQKMKNLYMHYAYDETMLNKLSIYSALDLYLDFINIFLYVIRLIGKKD